MEREKFLRILKELRDVCDEVNSETKKEDPNNKVIYEVLQFSDLANKWDSVFNIADFYNHNWLGNIDFMHIPDFNQTLQNCRTYPIIIAREKDSNKILGISTIKYDENTETNIDPYFPEENAHYFSITGILTRKNNTHKGIGKKIYEIAVRGSNKYAKHYPKTRLMCVIDCRNRQSLKALASAIENIKNNNSVGINKELEAYIIGYYELRDKENNNLIEAPTLVMEINLDEKESTTHTATTYEQVIEFNKKDNENLFGSLLLTLKDKFSRYSINPPIIQEDTDCGIVCFYSLADREKCKIQGINIIPNGTEQGNDRIPVLDKTMHSFIGPVPPILVETVEGDDR